MTETQTATGGLCACCGEKKRELCDECRCCRDCACCLKLREQIRQMARDAWSEPAEEMDA